MPTSVDWGDIPTWFAAIGTVATFVVYYFLLRGEINKREAEERNRATYTQRRISAWIDSDILFIQNLGDEPVYGLVVTYGPGHVNFDSPEDAGGFVELVIPMLGPQQKITEKVNKKYIKEIVFSDFPQVALEFTDSSGMHWRRQPMGELKNITHRRPYD